MAIYGRRMCCPERRSSRVLFTTAGLFLALVFQAGCALEFGARPRVDRLGGLTRGVSTKADVLLLLGEPRGAGGGQVSPESSPESIWLYEFTRAQGNDVSLEILLVFFDEDRYDGHLWFQSTEDVRLEADLGVRRNFARVEETSS